MRAVEVTPGDGAQAIARMVDAGAVPVVLDGQALCVAEKEQVAALAP